MAKDGFPAVLGVHLFGDHVVPILVLRARFGSRPDLYRSDSRVRALHVAYRLVSLHAHSTLISLTVFFSGNSA